MEMSGFEQSLASHVLFEVWGSHHPKVSSSSDTQES